MTRSESPILASSLFELLCLVWGSGWLALKLGVATMPPLAFAGSRFIAAGAILLAWLVMRGRVSDLMRLPFRGLVPSTLLMISVNYGLMAWGVTHVASGIAAVVNLSTIPLAMACFTAAYGQSRWSWRKVLGLATGSTGLAVLFPPALVATVVSTAAGAGAEHLVVSHMAASGTLGLLAIVAGAACYAWGSVLMRRSLLLPGSDAAVSPIALSTLQALLGGAVLMVASVFIEPWGKVFKPTALAEILAPVRLGGWGFLVAVSVVSTPVYLALLSRWVPSRVAAYAYVCPVIAVSEGIVFGGETLTWTEAGGAVLLAASALLVLGTAEEPQAVALVPPAASDPVLAPTVPQPESSPSSYPHSRPGASR